MSVTLSPAQAHDLVRAALIAHDTAPANAASVARALVAAELAGQSGHGLRRVPTYAAQAAAGKVRGHATPLADTPRPGTLRIDAGHGFAYPALELALAHLPDMARANGIAVAGITRSHHAGVAGLPVEYLARQGLVALMFANTPAAMAPWGGRRALLGTDPIAFAAPLGADAGPVVVDVSLSRIARGKLMAAAQKGEPIPEGWALDADGNPTTDPAAGMNGTMLPMGGAKGTALALMVELLAAGLTGANYAHQASSFLDAEGPPPGTGQLLIAIDPEALGGAGATAHMALLAGLIAAEPGARLPGARRHALRDEAGARGIVLDDSFAATLQALAGADGLAGTGGAGGAG